MACNQQQCSRTLTAATADKLRQLHVTDWQLCCYIGC